MAVKRNIKKLDFCFTKEQLHTFIDKLTDLSAIDDYIVFKLDSEDFLIYSIATATEDKAKRTILAFKCFSFKTPEVITIKGDFDEKIIYIMKDVKKTIKSLRNYLDFDEAVSSSITYDTLNDLFFGDTIKFKNSKLKLNFQGGSPRDANTKVSLKSIQAKSTPDMLDFKFNISKDDFLKAKKMSLIESENDLVYFNIIDNELFVAENRWALKIQDITFEDINICIPKKYFKTATCDTVGIDVDVYRTHLIFNNDKSSLMIARQMSI